MSQAESLLSNLSEQTSKSSTSTNEPLVIDGETRKITVPSTETLFGVETDRNVERKYFKGPKIVGDNIDLTALKLQIHYKNSLGEKDKCDVTDLEEADGAIYFSWLLGADLFKAKGTVSFSIRAMGEDENGNEVCVWNTTYASGTVLEGLNADEDDDSKEGIVINSSTAGSTKQYRITIDDDGILSVTPL